MRLQWREGMPAQPDATAPRLAPLPAPPARSTPTPTGSIDTPAAAEPAAKLLIVGPDINLSGEITACDRLVVEGSVQVTLNRTRAIEIAETGRFTNGKAEVEDAEIAGVYEGSLTVRKRPPDPRHRQGLRHGPLRRAGDRARRSSRGNHRAACGRRAAACGAERAYPAVGSA